MELSKTVSPQKDRRNFSGVHSDLFRAVRQSGISDGDFGRHIILSSRWICIRERKIKAKRGRILDRNGIVLADNQPVCTISVIHNQIRDPDAVIALLCSKLDCRKRPFEKKSGKGIVHRKNQKQCRSGNRGRKFTGQGLDGIKVDEDYKRYYPYENLASKVIGFTGGDNQEFWHWKAGMRKCFPGREGLILEMTDARGVRLLEERAG